MSQSFLSVPWIETFYLEEKPGFDKSASTSDVWKKETKEKSIDIID